MKLLLDTHIALWAAKGSANLPSAAAALIGDASNEIYVSVISLWEIGVKASNGKLDVTATQASTVFDICGYRTLDINRFHIRTLDGLAMCPGHKDPFDRMLVAQALTEGMTLVTADAKMTAYRPTTRVV
ncbi:type II toxin-antitoxin system VapC family toxin [Cupriavidus agavae]|uniref:PIN domain nuclease of toxin-antitoxin system n=1 Tax=Cupriavidus agavae TaxID=1001822 RepID=A0A4Q7RWX9_9BURK|nr:type II toxin-antitoxin system VapC family toxin [Cupriavidus agavae]RZT38413.1 PIN domain nuclease of toxin-antitoxin system [Cupriavidus agavae]